MTIEIVKAAVDIGIQTNRLEEQQSFWADTVGLRFDHLLKVGGGVHQYRYDLHGAVLKLNSHRDPLEERPTGFVGLTTVADVPTVTSVRTVDGTPVTLVPTLGEDVRTVIATEARNAGATLAAWTDGLGATTAPDGAARIGETRIDIREVPSRPTTHQRDGLGIRYLTVQVRDVRAAHAHAVGHGCTEGLAPVRLGDTAFISFVRLPDGDWIELSQRASLTGPLPEDAPRA